MQKKTEKLWRAGLVAISGAVLLGLSGCSSIPPEEPQVTEGNGRDGEMEAGGEEKTDSLTALCRDFYREMDQKGDWSDLEMIRSIVNWFGEQGYAAVDSKNQVNMTGAEEVIRFCERAEAGEYAEQTIIQVNDLGGFVRFDLEAEDGAVAVVRSYYLYENGEMQKRTSGRYSAENWRYTQDGYILFERTGFSEDTYVLSLSEAEEYVALRVLPLEESCRELNREYILPVGYGENNMYLFDWSEEDYGEMDFYDLFALFYPQVYGQAIPYTADENLGVGAVYQIPRKEFEEVMMAYFDISSETLQLKTAYDPKTECYEYRPRGFYEIQDSCPYPEVVGYTQNSDGTLTLTVHAVFPRRNMSKVYAHEVVVRPLSGGGVQYVSNRIIPSEDNREPDWYTPRLTEEEWEELYGAPDTEKEEAAQSSGQGKGPSVGEEERTEAEADCKAVLGMVLDIYREADKGEALNIVLPEEAMLQMKAVIKEETARPVIGSERYSAMENYEEMEAFLEACTDGREGSVVLYRIHSGGIERLKYVFDGSRLYVLAASGTWNKEGQPVVASISCMGIKEWEYTEQGWFCYELCVPEPPEVTEIVDGSRMIRVKPMPERQRDMSLKYVAALGYQGNNLLCSSWDESHMEELDFNGLFEYLYKMKYGEAFAGDEYSGEIPAELFETVITAYLPVTAQELRAWAVFDGQKQTYAWEGLGCFNYTPTFFGTAVPEVTDIKENGDGTVTLTVEAVCSMVEYNEAVITHELTVRPGENGSFQYVGNRVLGDGMPPEYQYRVIYKSKKREYD